MLRKSHSAGELFFASESVPTDRGYEPNLLELGFQEFGTYLCVTDYAGAEQILDDIGKLHASDHEIEQLLRVLAGVVRVDRMYHSKDASLLTSGSSDTQMIWFDFSSLSAPTSPVAERVLGAAKAYVTQLEAIHVQRELSPDRFVDISVAADSTHELFSKPMQKLRLESQLLNVLMRAESNTSNLKGVEVFADLAQAEQKLQEYLNALRHACQSRSSARIPSRQQLGPRPMPQLALWYKWFYAHVLGRLRLLCGSGFQSAARLGPRQIAEPRVGGGADPASSAVGPTSPDPSRPAVVPKCEYVQELCILAEQPGVAFAGIFANVAKMPHLQGAIPLAASSGRTAHSSLATPFLDSAWLLTASTASKSQIGTSTSAETKDCEWWALAFVAASSGEVTMGLDALEMWRHSDEWRGLRSTLNTVSRRPRKPSHVSTASDINEAPHSFRVARSANGGDVGSKSLRCLVIPVDSGPIFLGLVVDDMLGLPQPESVPPGSTSDRSHACSVLDRSGASIALTTEASIISSPEERHRPTWWQNLRQFMKRGRHCTSDDRCEENPVGVNIERSMLAFARGASGRKLRQSQSSQSSTPSLTSVARKPSSTLLS